MSYSESPEKDQALIRAYKALPGWPKTLEPYPPREALRLVRLQQRPAIQPIQKRYELALAGSRRVSEGGNG